MTRASSFEEDWQLLEATASWLGRRDYQLAEERGPEGMNQGLKRFTGRHLDISIAADRGQWFVDAAPTEMSDSSFTLEAWSACLGEPVLFHDNRPRRTDAEWTERIAGSWHLTPQIEYLQAHLSEMEAVCAPSVISETISRLESARDRLQRGP